MKWTYLLSLLFTGVLSEKKLNLEDIETDHLRSENRGKKSPTPEQLFPDELKYSAKAEDDQQYYAPTGATAVAAASQELGNQVGDYTELQSYESFKYAPENQQQDYIKENINPSAYLRQDLLATSAAQQQHTPQHYYIQESQSHSSSGIDAQQQLYQQEVLVGNQLQSVQQKEAAQKYTDGSDDKGIDYINIPMSQLLAYYQNCGIVQSKSKNSERQVSIPNYTPTLTQNQVYAPTKVTYQPKLQYVPTYPKHTPAIIAKLPPASTILHAYSTATVAAPVRQIPSTSHQQYTGSVEAFMVPTYASAYQSERYGTEKRPQPHQYTHQYQEQQTAYENTPNSYQANTYNEPATTYEQDNFLYQQQQLQPQSKQQQYYVPTTVAEQLMSQLLLQTSFHNSIEATQPQIMKQEPVEQLHTEFTPPRYKTQKFSASQEITHLVPVLNAHEYYPSKSSHSSASYSIQPKTLLDTYVPSHVIAAQDTNRYRERPIKLESGFLPSKINFIEYKKRKTE